MPAKNNNPLKLTLAGRTQLVGEWAAETGIPEPTIRARLSRLGWDLEKALTTPPAKKYAHSPGRPAVNAVRAVPRLKRHSCGQAFVRWMQQGQRFYRYFGAWNSAEAREGYAQFVRDWADIIGGREQKEVQPGQVVTVGELVGLWLDRCKERYTKLGKQTSEYHCHRAACAPLLDRFEQLPVSKFGLQQLEQVRRDMVKKQWARKSVNRHVARIVAAFGWGVPRKLVPGDVHYSLERVEHLTPGSTEAKESEPVRPVPAADVEAVLKGHHLHPEPGRRAVLAAMVRVQRLTGMRPGALCAMTPDRVTREGKEWRYDVAAEGNKNYHRGQDLVVWVGPRAQAVLRPLLEAAGPGEPVFRFPAVRNAEAKPWRPVSVHEYSRCVAAACESAGVKPWTPHQLRHAMATDVRRRFGLEGAQVMLGHAHANTTEIYAEKSVSLAQRIAREVG